MFSCLGINMGLYSAQQLNFGAVLKGEGLGGIPMPSVTVLALLAIASR